MRRNCHPHTVCKQEIRSNSFIYLYLFIFKYLYCLSPDKGCLCVTLGKMVQLILNTNIFLLFSLINLWAMISMNFCSTMYSETSDLKDAYVSIWETQNCKNLHWKYYSHIYSRKRNTARQTVQPVIAWKAIAWIAWITKYWLSTNYLHSKDHLDNINILILSNSIFLH